MTIAQMLQKANYVRVSVGDRWLTSGHPKWTVYERKYKQKNTREIYRGKSESEAVKHLLAESDLYSDVYEEAIKS